MVPAGAGAAGGVLRLWALSGCGSRPPAVPAAAVDVRLLCRRGAVGVGPPGLGLRASKSCAGSGLTEETGVAAAVSVSDGVGSTTAWPPSHGCMAMQGLTELDN